MNLKQIEKEVFHLSENERAALAQKILISLDAPEQDDINLAWLSEAKKRAQDIDAGLVKAISGEDVRRKAQTLLR